MYAFIPHLDRDAGGRDAARAGPSDVPDADAAVRRAVTLGAAALLTLSLAACGDSDRTWGSTESSDRSSETRAEGQRATPPPTPDYRELAAASGREADSTGRERAEDAPRADRPLPRNVSFPEAESLYHRGDHREALRRFAAYTEEHPDNFWGHYMLGLSAWKAGERERAVSALERSLELDPDHVKSRVNLSRVLLELERPEDARRHIREAVDLAPGSADALRVAGNVADELGETETALRRYRQALAVDGSDGWSANNLGLLLLRRGRWTDALGPLARAAELQPEVAVFRNNLGAALERTGHLERAREQYRRASGSGHEKAEASLARLEGVRPGGEAEPVELEALARSFAERVEGWTADRLAKRRTEPPRPDSVRPPSDAGAGDPSGEDPGGSEPQPPEESGGAGGPGTGDAPPPDAAPRHAPEGGR